jgi:anaerobic magnesium-protoporphyrin IX monomethyl ester cyclase
MKVMLVVKSKAIECLGVMYLSGVVKQAGHMAKIVTLDDAIPTSKSWKPDIVGFSVMTGDQHKMIAAAAQIRSKYKPIIIFGGAHATFFPRDFEKYDFINIVAKGEWEQSMAELMGSGTKYPDVNSLPWPDRYDFPNMPIRDFLASRGCPNRCSYCYNHAWNNMFPELAKVRYRTPQDVVDEVVSVDPQFVYFQDSCFGVKTYWLREFSRLYRIHANIPFHCHLRPEQVNQERVLLLHDSNCVSVKIALETASDRLRKLINRGNQKNEDVYIAARLLKKWDIKLILQNIIGLPTATIEEDLATLEVNIRCRPAYSWVSIFQPYPATELAMYCEKEGIYTGDYSEIGDNFFDKSVLNISDEHKEQIAVLQRIFAFCVEMQVMPKVEDLTWERLPKFIHATMRKIGDKRMFPGIPL